MGVVVEHGIVGTPTIQTANAPTLGTAYNITLSGTLSGTGSLTSTGLGSLILSGPNTFNGGVNLNGGIVQVNGAEIAGTSGPLGKSGNIDFGGGTLQYTSNDTNDYSSRIASGASTSAVSIDTNGQTITFGTALTSGEAGGLAVSSTTAGGKLILSVNNTYGTGTTLTSGTLQLGTGTASALGAAVQ